MALSSHDLIDVHVVCLLPSNSLCAGIDTRAISAALLVEANSVQSLAVVLPHNDDNHVDTDDGSNAGTFPAASVVI